MSESPTTKAVLKRDLKYVRDAIYGYVPDETPAQSKEFRKLSRCLDRLQEHFDAKS